ncbi:acyl-CoA thioesterase [Fluviicola taffensis]|uniref:Thioesterase superfamily protein n=1 Tax=Fluviicola taffensis (strain DSM 16823 / NCIMB 13979 / RW262) TaxID=755732 RepID=F2IHP2_FLUTR|nr:thioesterase family protein [Fluviicola taffensis]AEA44820.1 thioesterase superfamily protein [Fluviicola taffensis DSM 16823]
MLDSYKLQVRFSDCDMMQHVNNAVYLNYFEEARIHYFRQMLGVEWDWKKTGVILRKNELEYLKPVFLHEPVEIFVYLKHIGEKSFTLSYEVKVLNEVKTTGSSVLVCYDSVNKISIPIPKRMKDALGKLSLKLEQ